MNPADRVRALIKQGKLDPEEGARLLAAMGAERERARWTQLLLDPFERLAGEKATIIGALIAALCVAVSRLGVRFDGFLDLHVVKEVPSLHVALLDQVVAWGIPALVFWLVSLVWRIPGRFVDFVGMIGLARLPSLITAAPARWLSPPTLPPEGARLLVIVAIALVSLGLQITLLFRGFQNATGARGGRLVSAFVVGVIVSELVSKVLVWSWS